MAVCNEMSLVYIRPYQEWLSDYLADLGLVKRRPKKKSKTPVAAVVKPKQPLKIIEDEAYLRSLDPRNWKEQDHYAVLGIKHLRINADEDDVKKAYRKMVLKHHPDKRVGEKIDAENDYFACIVKAYEILGDSTKRRSYDSVDKYFDDHIPEVTARSKKNFYDVFGCVFERNARWSNCQPVPFLGNDSSQREDVEEFYNFWYSFDSWREFSYLDEEDKEKGSDRDERRWIEKQNKAERLKKKKQETARVRQLVDNAYACDPRIPRFKAEEKERKNAKKKAAEEAKKAKAAEELRIRKEQDEAERLRKEEEDRVANEKKDAEKKAKASLKKLIRKEKKTIEQFLVSVDYFTTNEKQRLVYLEEFYKLADTASLEQLRELRKGLEGNGDFDSQRELFLNHIKQDTTKPTQENFDALKNKINEAQSKPWLEGEVQLLAKAFSLYPAGTQNRWETVCDYLKQHSTSGIERKPKEILVKVKEMQKQDPSLKTFMGKPAGHTKTFEPVENTFANGFTNGNGVASNGLHEENGKSSQPWTAEEQKLLEQALKSVPSSAPDKWEKIAELVPDRSKKECMRRYKELVELVRSKKVSESK